MLDVQRRPNVDAGLKQFIDVLPTFGMAAAGDIGVRVFIDQQQIWPPRQCGIEIEFAHELIAVDDGFARQNFETVNELFRLSAAVRFDKPCDYIAPAGSLALGGREHGVSLADARGGAQKNLKPAPAFFLGQGQQCIR